MINRVKMIKVLNPFENVWKSESIFESIVLINKIKTILEELKIKWWISMGTLLGQYHFGHMFPWDDDIDIQVLFENQKQYDEFNNLINVEIKGFEFEFPKEKGNLIFFQKAVLFKKHGKNMPIIDLTCSYCSKKTILGRGNKNYFYNIFPTKNVKFLGINVSAPRNEKLFLIEKYGKKCMTNAMAYRYNHELNRPVFIEYVDYDFLYSHRLVKKSLNKFNSELFTIQNKLSTNSI